MTELFKSVQATGQTVDAAVEAALTQLGLTLEEVSIDVLDEGAKGFLGFGAREAKVQAAQLDTARWRAKLFLEGVGQRMGAPCEAKVEPCEDGYAAELSGEQMGILIGHRGEVLDALQYLSALAAGRSVQAAGKHVRVRLDTEGYRAKREQTLMDLARKMESRVRRTHRRMALEPMTPNERRVLHTALQDSPYVTTHSEGDEPARRVVITPKQ